MANNVALLPENAGRVTAPSLAYPYGSAKDDSTGSTGDGMPVKIAYFNDSFGMQQALLRAAGLAPTGNADTALASQYMQAIIQLAAGRAGQYDATGTGDAHVLALQANQQAPGGLFEGQKITYTAPGTNTAAGTTVDVSVIKGEPVGTSLLTVQGVTGASQLFSGAELTLVYRSGALYIADQINPKTGNPVALIGKLVWDALETAGAGEVTLDGAELSRTDAHILFAKAQASGLVDQSTKDADLDTYGGMWGDGDGSTTFTLPAISGAFIRAADDGRGLDPGRTFASWQEDDIEQGSFNVRADAGGSAMVALGQGSVVLSSGGGSITVNGNSAGQPVTNVTIGSGADTRPMNYAYFARTLV